MPIGTKGFTGCIGEVELTFADSSSLSLSSKHPVDSRGLSLCPVQVRPGVLLNGANAYVLLDDFSHNTNTPSFRIAVGFSVSMSFRTSSVNATLLAAWGSSSCYAALSVFNGQIRIVLASDDRSLPFIATSNVLPTIDAICSGDTHTVSLTLDSRYVALQLDAYQRELFPLNGFTYCSTLSVPIYIGGYKGISEGRGFNGLVDLASLNGCVESISVNGEQFALSESTDKQSTTAGCPVA